MDQDIFSGHFAESPLGMLLIRIAKWQKVIAIMGLFFQAIVLSLGYIHYREYVVDLVKYPSFVQRRFEQTLVDSIEGVLFTFLYVLVYRFASSLREAVRSDEPPKKLEQAFRLNLTFIRYDVFLLAVTILYYIYILVREITMSYKMLVHS